MLKKIYRKYYKSSIINRTLFTFLIITVSSLFILTEIILYSFGKILEENELSLNNKILDRVGTFIDQKYTTSLKIYQRMYFYESDRTTRPIDFFNTDGGRSDENNMDAYRSMDRYTTSYFQLDPDIFDILITREGEENCYINESSAPVMRELDRLPAVFSLSGRTLSKGFTVLPAHETAYSRTRRTVFTLAANVTGTYSQMKTGEIFIEFNTETIRRAYREYQENVKGYIIILTKSGDVVFDSSGRYYGEKYPYMKSLESGRKEADLEEISIINRMTPKEADVIIAGIIPKSEILAAINTIKRTFYLISFLVILISVVLAYLNTTRISRRVRVITGAMKKLRKGDLSGRIPVGADNDEFSDIASNFNQMCGDLENYIEKVYLSEIQQKTAQLKALQSQINPHFLYNTLEAIRMRAITKGDEEAGEMIHLLAALFRSTIRDHTFIEISNEIKYCNMYLELFKIRYGDRLAVNFRIDGDIEIYGIPKHLLQPVIENYIIHGFDMDRTDNRIDIHGWKENGDIIFSMEDNGMGMEDEKLSAIRESLKQPFTAETDSIGLPNVNERIRLIFGKGYGLSISSRQGCGTAVTLKIKAMMREELERYVQDTAGGR